MSPLSPPWTSEIRTMLSAAGIGGQLPPEPQPPVEPPPASLSVASTSSPEKHSRSPQKGLKMKTSVRRNKQKQGSRSLSQEQKSPSQEQSTSPSPPGKSYRSSLLLEKSGSCSSHIVAPSTKKMLEMPATIGPQLFYLDSLPPNVSSSSPINYQDRNHQELQPQILLHGGDQKHDHQEEPEERRRLAQAYGDRNNIAYFWCNNIKKAVLI